MNGTRVRLAQPARQPELFATDGIARGAIFDESHQYRYVLWRIWDESLPRLLFIMLNPSKADGREDDRTIAKCIKFAKRWGYGGFYVVNLFALCTTDWQGLLDVADPVGPLNDMHIRDAIADTQMIICAYGVHGTLKGRDKEVKAILRQVGDVPMKCLRLTKNGHPEHPLYIPDATEPIEFYV